MALPAAGVPRLDAQAGSPSAAVRSYKRRGRLRAAQVAALEDLWPRFGVALGQGRPGDGRTDHAVPDRALFDPVATFGRRAPLVLEIGFGTGDATLAMAAADPARDVLAVEVYRPGAASLMKELAAAGLTNVRVAVADAVVVLAEQLTADSLDEIRIFFPDPWPKAKHHKRRLVDAAFVALAASRLRPSGRLHLATDWQDYADQMLAAVTAEPLLANASGDAGGFAPRPPWRPQTRFERQGLDRGHAVRDIVVHRV